MPKLFVKLTKMTAQINGGHRLQREREREKRVEKEREKESKGPGERRSRREIKWFFLLILKWPCSKKRKPSGVPCKEKTCVRIAGKGGVQIIEMEI